MIFASISPKLRASSAVIEALFERFLFASVRDVAIFARWRSYYGPLRTALYATSPRSGKFNDLAYASSIDLLLGQGQLKNPYLAKKIDFDQKMRCYQFTAEPGAGLTDEAIRADSLSISAVAGSAQAADQLRQLKAGQTVRIQGKYAAVTLRKSQQPFIVGMSIPRPRPHCAIVKVTSIQALN